MRLSRRRLMNLLHPRKNTGGKSFSLLIGKNEFMKACARQRIASTVPFAKEKKMASS